MKKIVSLIITCFVFFSFSGIDSTFAEWKDVIKVKVSEKVPGANCTCPGWETEKKCEVYTCEVEKGFNGFMSFMQKALQYITFLTGLIGVLYIVINGIMYSMGGIDPSMKDTAKKRILWTLIGLVILLLSAPILNLIAPCIYK